MVGKKDADLESPGSRYGIPGNKIIKIISSLPSDKFEEFNEFHIQRYPLNSDFIYWVIRNSSFRDIPVKEIDTESDFFEVYIGNSEQPIMGDWKHYDNSIVDDVNSAIYDYGQKIKSREKNGVGFLLWITDRKIPTIEYVNILSNDWLELLRERKLGISNTKIAWIWLCLMYSFDLLKSNPNKLRIWEKYKDAIYNSIKDKRLLMKIYNFIDEEIRNIEW